MVPGNVRVFPLWTEFPLPPEGGAGWSQTGYSIPRCNPSWNAWCTAFREHGAGCPPVHFIIPDRRCQGNLITPRAVLRAIDRVWPGCTMGAILQALL